MPSSIKEEYSKPVKPAVESRTIKSVILAAFAVVLEHIVTASPAIAMFIFTILPDWLKNLVTLEVIQSGVEYLLYAIAGYAGITIVGERIKKGDIQGVLKAK
jgi:hypothetical protein